MGHHNAHGRREAEKRQRQEEKEIRRRFRQDGSSYHANQILGEIIFYGNLSWYTELDKDLHRRFSHFDKNFSGHHVVGGEAYLSLLDHFPELRVGAFVVEGVYRNKDWKYREFFELLGKDYANRTCLVRHESAVPSFESLKLIRPFIDVVLPRRPIEPIYQYMVRKAAELNGK
ncbi:hypothetical protein J4233_00295 [Candidatus Pacearchaeota archaeon]|nr:hypothetical protein [Candidatus Pacearchaeota archaeon]